MAESHLERREDRTETPPIPPAIPRVFTDRTEKFSQKWTIGDVTVTKIIETELTQFGPNVIPEATPERLLTLPWLQPHFCDDRGWVRMSVHALVIDTPTRRLIVDTCFGSDKDRAPWPDFDRMQTPFLEDLEAAGFERDSFDYVLCTHLHIDHVGWNTKLSDDRWVPTFPNARYFFDRTEYEYWRRGSGETNEWTEIQRLTFADSVLPIVEAGLAELVDGHCHVCDEISLIPTIGHSPGHVSVRILSQGQEALITGDMAHHPCQLAHTGWHSVFDFDVRQAAVTRDEVFANIADRDVLVIGTHWAGATAGKIVREGEAFRIVT